MKIQMNFKLVVKGQPDKLFETLPNAFLEARKIQDKSTIEIVGPHRTYKWFQLLEWARAADVIDGDGNLNRRALKRR